MRYGEAIYLESMRKARMGEFGYGDFGAANADRIIDEAGQSWTDKQIQEIKGKWRAMVLGVQQTVRDRNELIEAIEAMPAGDAKTRAVAAFTEADSTFIQAYNAAIPLFNQFQAAGDTLPAARQTNFGLAPLAMWGLVAAAAVTVAYITTAMYETRTKYSAIMQNPEVAKYLPAEGFLSMFGTELGSSMKWGMIALAGVLVFSMMRKTA